MKSNYSHLKLNYKIWLETADSEGVLGDGKWILLKMINEKGSLKAAMEELDLSYRKTWNNLRKIEKKLGFPLLDTSRGGADGGSTTLTPDGVRIVKAFDKFHKDFDLFAQQSFEKFIKDLNKE